MKKFLKIQEKRIETFTIQAMAQHEKLMNKFEENQDKRMALLDEKTEKLLPKILENQETRLSESIKGIGEDQNRRMLIFEDKQKRMVELVEKQEAKMTQMFEMYVLV